MQVTESICLNSRQVSHSRENVMVMVTARVMVMAMALEMETTYLKDLINSLHEKSRKCELLEHVAKGSYKHQDTCLIGTRL